MDVGTEAVKCLIVSKKEDKTNILSSGISYIDETGSFENPINPEDFELENFKNAIKSCLEQSFAKFALLSKKDKIEIEKPKIIALLSVLKASTAECSFERSNPGKKISEKEKDSILENAVGSAKKKISEAFFKKTGILSQDIEWTRLDVIRTSIEGYPVSSMRGRKGGKIDFKVRAVFGPKNHLKKIRKIFDDLDADVAKILHISEVLPEMFNGKMKNALFVDIGGKTTQLFFFREGKIDLIREVEMGGLNFSEVLARVMNLEKDQARLLKEDYADKLLSPESEERVKNALSFGKRDWREEFKNLKNPGYPAYFFGGGSMLKEARTIVAKRKVMLPKSFKKLSSIEAGIKSSQFVPCIIVSLFKND